MMTSKDSVHRRQVEERLIHFRLDHLGERSFLCLRLLYADTFKKVSLTAFECKQDPKTHSLTMQLTVLFSSLKLLFLIDDLKEDR